MFEVLVAGAVGAIAGPMAWAIARWSGPAGSQRHRSVLLLSFVALFTLGNAALMPHARAWKQERDVDALLEREPLFAAVVADEPSLREPLRDGLLKALRSGERAEALLVGQRLLSPRLWRYVPRASDAAALELGRALVGTLAELQARDPEQCYRFLFPAVAGPPRGGGSPRDDQILRALRAVVASARDGTAEPLDRVLARKHYDAVFVELGERYGADLDVLRHPEERGVAHAKVCAMTVALYSELVALDPPAAGQALRYTLGPAGGR